MKHSKELEQLLYCLDGYTTDHVNGNYGDADEWLRHVRNAYEVLRDTLDKEEETKTSKEWQDIQGLVVLDPDGWDRTNYQYSFHEELITLEEFNNRVIHSTIIRNIWEA